MSSKNETDGLDAFMDIWKQSQDAFLKAQEQVSDQFRKSLSEMSDTIEREAAEPFAAWQSLIRSWAPAWDNPQNASTSAEFANGRDMFFEFLDPQKWTKYAPEQLRVILEQIARGPQFADLATPQKNVASAWRESVDYQEAAADMSRVMQTAWMKAYQSYSTKHDLEDLKSGNVNGALDAWLKYANEALLEAQGSADFLDAQKRMIRASTEIRARQRDMAEQWSETWQMPTRTEIDDLALSVHQLRRELREVKRELNKLKETKS